MYLYFHILPISPSLNLGSLSLVFLLESIYARFYINRLHFNCAMIGIGVFVHDAIYFINIHIF